MCALTMMTLEEPELKYIWAFAQKKKKKKAGPLRKRSWPHFYLAHLCLSCSWLKFGSQDTFSQFPFLMFLELCCRIVGNAESGESAKKDFSPSQEGPIPHLRHHMCGAAYIPTASSLPLLLFFLLFFFYEG